MSNSISKHNVLSLDFCACPCTHTILHALFQSSQPKQCFTGTSDDLWISLLIMGILMKRLSVFFWCRAGVHCYPSNELYFGAPAETFWKGSLLISGFHYKHQTGQCLLYCTGLYLWCAGRTRGRETKAGSSNLLHRSVQEAKQPRVMRTHILTAYWMAAKAVSWWIVKKNKLNQKKISSPTVWTARLSFGRAALLWYIEVVKSGVSACKNSGGCKSLYIMVIKSTMKPSCG